MGESDRTFYFFATQPMVSLGGFSVSIQMNSMPMIYEIKLQYYTSQDGSNLRNLLCSNLLSKLLANHSSISF